MSISESPNTRIAAPLIGQLDSRDVALWLAGSDDGLDAAEAADLSRLPWSVVLTERSDDAYTAALEAAEPIDGPLVRRRGLVHVVDTNPSDIVLPPRHLAVLLMNGRGAQRRTGVAAMTRRLTMLQELRRRSVRQIVVAVAGTFMIPEELGDLWADGFRTAVLFVSDDPAAPEIIQQWRQEFSARFVDHNRLSPAEFSARLQREYLSGRDGALVVRMRDEKGTAHVVE